MDAAGRWCVAFWAFPSLASPFLNLIHHYIPILCSLLYMSLYTLYYNLLSFHLLFVCLSVQTREREREIHLPISSRCVLHPEYFRGGGLFALGHVQQAHRAQGSPVVNCVSSKVFKMTTQ
jgi:hypothetical protein